MQVHIGMEFGQLKIRLSVHVHRRSIHQVLFEVYFLNILNLSFSASVQS